MVEWEMTTLVATQSAISRQPSPSAMWTGSLPGTAATLVVRVGGYAERRIELPADGGTGSRREPEFVWLRRAQ